LKFSADRIGVLIALGAAACFALSNTITVVAYRGGSNPLTVTASRFILPALLLFIILRAKGLPLSLPRAAGLALVLGVGQESRPGEGLWLAALAGPGGPKPAASPDFKTLSELCSFCISALQHNHVKYSVIKPI